jgi:hypothetical protein
VAIGGAISPVRRKLRICLYLLDLNKNRISKKREQLRVMSSIDCISSKNL